MRTRLLAWVSSLLLALMALATVATPVWADNAGLSQTDRQPYIARPRSEAELKLIEEYRRDASVLCAILESVRHGQLPVSEYEKALRHFGRKWKASSALLFSAGGQIGPLNLIITRVLGVNAIAQQTTYYCGPASAVQLLSYMGVNQNPYDGRPTTQDNLATDLHTDTTGTGRDYWEPTLRSWTAGIVWEAVWNPNVVKTNLWDATRINVDLNRPLIYDAHMTATNGYLPGYTSGEVYHYITGDGYMYDEYGTQDVHYVDPNQYRSAAFGPHWTTLTQMYNVVRDCGYVW